jgi:hypothetical protein
MELLVSEKHTKERKIADIIINKLKVTATKLESNNSIHKDGVKYNISKKMYEEIISSEFESRKIMYKDTMIVREFINRKLVKV